jgi:hypothetical protein
VGARAIDGATMLVLHKHAGFWGSEEAMASEPASAYELPLGNLEFALDRSDTHGPEVDGALGLRGRARAQRRDRDASPRDHTRDPTVRSVCASCAGSEMVPCPACDGRGLYHCSFKIPDVPSLPDGTRPMGRMQVTCKSCSGRGMVVCRECFDGDPYDLEVVRQLMRSKPD